MILHMIEFEEWLEEVHPRIMTEWELYYADEWELDHYVQDQYPHLLKEWSHYQQEVLIADE